MHRNLLILILLLSPQLFAQSNLEKSSLADDLVELAELFERGMRADEEFSAAKAELLNVSGIPSETSVLPNPESPVPAIRYEIAEIADLAVREGTYSGMVMNIGTEQSPQYIPHCGHLTVYSRRNCCAV